MSVCENQVAARFAFPQSEMPVRDRRMTLEIQCRDQATYTSTMSSLGQGKSRAGAQSKSFALCDNHSQLYSQIDRELVQDAWAPCMTGKPAPLQ